MVILFSHGTRAQLNGTLNTVTLNADCTDATTSNACGVDSSCPPSSASACSTGSACNTGRIDIAQRLGITPGQIVNVSLVSWSVDDEGEVGYYNAAGSRVSFASSYACSCNCGSQTGSGCAGAKPGSGSVGRQPAIYAYSVSDCRPSGTNVFGLVRSSWSVQYIVCNAGFTAQNGQCACNTQCAGKCGGPNGCGGACSNTCQAPLAVCQPDNTTCCAQNSGQSCSACNACGQCNSGTYDCRGACPAATPPPVPESDAAFCARNSIGCGDYAGTDNCGNPRSANCGKCVCSEDMKLLDKIRHLTVPFIFSIFEAISRWALVVGIVLGVVAIGFAGHRIVTSAGDAERLSRGKKALLWAIAGIAVLILARSLVLVVGHFLGIDITLFSGLPPSLPPLDCP